MPACGNSGQECPLLVRKRQEVKRYKLLEEEKKAAGKACNLIGGLM